MGLTRRDRKKLRRLTEMYASLPTVDCKRLCHIYCIPVPFYRIERMNLERAAGEPLRWPRASLAVPLQGACPYLNGDSCTVHAVRPLICRIYGCLERLRCPYGCVPSRWMTPEEVSAMRKELSTLD